MIRALTPEEQAEREDLIEASADKVIAKLRATLVSCRKFADALNDKLKGLADDYPGRLDRQPEQAFARHVMDDVADKLLDYPDSWDQHAVDYICSTVEGEVSFDREQLNNDVCLRVRALVGAKWGVK